MDCPTLENGKQKNSAQYGPTPYLPPNQCQPPFLPTVGAPTGSPWAHEVGGDNFCLWVVGGVKPLNSSGPQFPYLQVEM